MSSFDSFVLETLLSVCILLFVARIAVVIARRIGIAAIVAELLVGVLLAPTLLGGIHVLGVQLIVVNDGVKLIAQLGAVMLLFMVGMETKFAEFSRKGPMAVFVACGGVIISFVLGYGFVTLWGYPFPVALLVGTALTATSISITAKVLQDIGQGASKESMILLGSAVMDDIIGLIVLAIAMGLLSTGTFDLAGALFTGVKSLGFWVLLTLAGVFILSRIIDRASSRPCDKIQEVVRLAPGQDRSQHCTVPCDGPQEGMAIAIGFGFAYLAGAAGLAPILGAFSAGMAMAETKIMSNVHRAVKGINYFLAPLFFVVIGTYVDLTGISTSAIVFSALLIGLAMLGKFLGCGLPALIMSRDLKSATIVGLGMMCRGEVELIIAGIGAAAGYFTGEVILALILMVVVTTVLTPTIMNFAYKALSYTSGPAEPGVTA